MTPCADALAAFTQRTIAPHRRPAAIGLHLRALRMQSVCVRRCATQKSKALLTHLLLAVTVLVPQQRYAQHGSGGQ